jgi:hypothetical protein
MEGVAIFCSGRSCVMTSNFIRRNAMLRVNARQGAPTGGNSVIESFLVSSVVVFYIKVFYFSLNSYS